MIAVRDRATGEQLVVKQALERLRVESDWRATPARTETEAAAMALCGRLTPGAVPRVLATDGASHVVAMELAPGENWQQEIAAGRPHVGAGAAVGSILGRWHSATTAETQFDDLEAFEQLRLRPFHETVAHALPETASAIAALLEDLRTRPTCLVHGDYAMKNVLVGPSGPIVLDFEVAHHGNPVFDLGFFLSFTILSAIRWPALADDMHAVADAFQAAHAEASGSVGAVGEAAIAAHTGALVLARTDGMSPAQFLDAPSRRRARAVGLALLLEPGRGLWGWA